MHIESDVYDDNNNFIYRRIITQSGQPFRAEGLLEETHYNVRSRKNINGIFSDYSYRDFTAQSAEVLNLFYVKNVNFGAGWRGDLYRRNLATNQETLIDSQVSIFSFWTMPKLSKNNRYIAYHTYTDQHGYQFKVRDLQTNSIIKTINDNSQHWMWWNWKANSSDDIYSLYGRKHYKISTDTVGDGINPSLGGQYWSVLLNNAENTFVYNSNGYSNALSRRDMDGTDFAFLSGARGTSGGGVSINEDETKIISNFTSGNFSYLDQINTSDWSYQSLANNDDSGLVYKEFNQKSNNIINNKLYVKGRNYNNTNIFQVFELDLDTMQYTEIYSDPVSFYLCDAKFIRG